MRTWPAHVWRLRVTHQLQTKYYTQDMFDPNADFSALMTLGEVYMCDAMPLPFRLQVAEDLG